MFESNVGAYLSETPFKAYGLASKHLTRLEKPVSYKHSCFLGAFISYEENKVLWILTRGPYSQHFIFLVTCEWALQARALHYTKQEWLAKDKHSILLGTFVSYKEKVFWRPIQLPFSQHFIFLLTNEWDQ
jgi:hypothetical protein